MEVAKELQGCVASPAVWFYIHELDSKLNQAEEDIRMLGRMGANICPVCAHYNHGEGDKQKCVSCIINRDTDNFEWRGIQHG